MISQPGKSASRDGTHDVRSAWQTCDNSASSLKSTFEDASELLVAFGEGGMGRKLDVAAIAVEVIDGRADGAEAIIIVSLWGFGMAKLNVDADSSPPAIVVAVAVGVVAVVVVVVDDVVAVVAVVVADAAVDDDKDSADEAAAEEELGFLEERC